MSAVPWTDGPPCPQANCRHGYGTTLDRYFEPMERPRLRCGICDHFWIDDDPQAYERAVASDKAWWIECLDHSDGADPELIRLIEALTPRFVDPNQLTLPGIECRR